MSIKLFLSDPGIVLMFEIDVILDEYQTITKEIKYNNLFEIDVILDEYQTSKNLYCFLLQFEIDVILDEYQTLI